MIPLAWPPTVARDNFLAIPLFERLELDCDAVFRGLPAEQGVARAARVTSKQSSISRHSTPLLLRVKEVCERPKTSSFLSVPLPVLSRNIGLSCVGTKSVFSRHSTHPSKKQEKFWRAQKPVSAPEIGRKELGLASSLCGGHGMSLILLVCLTLKCLGNYPG